MSTTANETIGTRMHRTDDNFHKLMDDFDALLKADTTEFDLPPPIDDGGNSNDAAMLMGMTRRSAKKSASSGVVLPAIGKQNSNSTKMLGSDGSAEFFSSQTVKPHDHESMRKWATSASTSNSSVKGGSAFTTTSMSCKQRVSAVDDAPATPTSSGFSLSSGPPLSLSAALRSTRSSRRGANNATSATNSEQDAVTPAAHLLKRAETAPLAGSPTSMASTPQRRSNKNSRAAMNDGIGETSPSPSSVESGAMPMLRFKQSSSTRQTSLQRPALLDGRPSTTGTIESYGLTEQDDGSPASRQMGSVEPTHSARPSSAASLRSSIASARRLMDEQDENDDDVNTTAELESSATTARTNMTVESSMIEANREAARREREQLEESLRQRAAERAAWREKRKEREAARTREKEQALAAVLHKELRAIETEEGPGRQKCERDEDDARCELVVAFESRVAETFKKENANRLEEEAIVEAAKQKRQAKLEAERAAFLESEERERWTRRVVESTRDTVWNETYERQLLKDVEDRDNKIMMRKFNESLHNPVLPLQTEERESRAVILEERAAFLNVIACVMIEELESSLRYKIECNEDDAFLNDVILGSKCTTQIARFSALELSQRQEAEFDALETLKEIFAEHCECIQPIVERELWQTVVVEAEARMKIEESERRGIECIMDGNSSSRQLVGKYASRVAEVTRQAAEFRKQKVEEILETELAKRILLHQRAAEDRILIMEYFNRDKQKVEVEVAQRKKLEVEQAIRAAQMLNIQSSSEDVTYKQQQKKPASGGVGSKSSGGGGQKRTASSHSTAPQRSTATKKPVAKRSAPIQTTRI